MASFVNQNYLRPRNLKEEQGQFDNLMQTGLLSGITSYTEYYKACLKGFHKVLMELEEIDLVRDFSAELLSAIHRSVFEQIHPWAGNFRSKTERVKVGEMYGVSGEFINIELELAKLQFHEILAISFYDQKNSRDIRAEVATAFLHARLNRIHSFSDGNGRCGRIILANQLYGLTGRELIIQDRMVYLSAMRAANLGNLSPLVNLLLTGSGQKFTEYNIDSPFNMVSEADKGDSNMDTLLAKSRYY